MKRIKCTLMVMLALGFLMCFGQDALAQKTATKQQLEANKQEMVAKLKAERKAKFDKPQRAERSVNRTLPANVKANHASKLKEGNKKLSADKVSTVQAKVKSQKPATKLNRAPKQRTKSTNSNVAAQRANAVQKFKADRVKVRQQKIIELNKNKN